MLVSCRYQTQHSLQHPISNITWQQPETPKTWHHKTASLTSHFSMAKTPTTPYKLNNPNTKHSSTPWKMRMAHPPNHHQSQGVKWHPHKVNWCPSQPLTHIPLCWAPMHETKIRHHHRIPHATHMLNKQMHKQPPASPNFACHNMCTHIGSRRSPHYTQFPLCTHYE